MIARVLLLIVGLGAVLFCTVSSAKEELPAPSGEVRKTDGGAALQGGEARVTGNFRTVDIYVDSGAKPLAAYQFAIRATANDALLVGLEGGEHAAFAKPPYYDLKALIDEKIVVAAFSTDGNLPSGRTRVARLHVQITGPMEPRYEVSLHTAAGADGTLIAAKIEVEASGK